MKRLIILAIISGLALSITSCINRPICSSEPQNNDTYKVSYLFEHDGCKVYRFRDCGNYVYFTNCNGSTANISSDSTLTTNVIKVPLK